MGRISSNLGLRTVARCFGLAVSLVILPLRVAGLPANAPPDPVAADGSPTPNFVKTVLSDLVTLTGPARTTYLGLLRVNREKVRGRLGELKDQERTIENQIAQLKSDKKKLEKANGDPKKIKEIDAKITDLENSVAPIRDQATTFLGMETFIVDLLQKEDPRELQLDFYGATVFSSLFRDPSKNEGYFSKSKPFLELEARQNIKHFGSDQSRGVDGWLRMSFQTSAFQSPDSNSNTKDLQETQSFSAEIGFDGWLPFDFGPNEALSFVPEFGIGVSGYDDAKEDNGLAAQDSNAFRFRCRAGWVIRQRSGSWQGSFFEFTYLRDPKFVAPNRFFARGRLVVAPLSGEGRGLGTYLETSVNVGPHRDEVRLAIGIRLDTLAILRAVIGGASQPTPASH